MADAPSIPKRHSITMYSTGNGDGASPISVPQLLVRSETLPPDHLTESGPASTMSSSEDDLDEIGTYLREDIRPSPLRVMTPVNGEIGEVISIFPRRITCMLSITFNARRNEIELDEQSNDGMTQFRNFEWYDEISYEKIKKRCDEVIEKVKGRSESQSTFIRHDKIYLRHGSCCVTGTTDETKYNPELSTFSEESLPTTAIRAICQFIGEFPCQKFDLVIYCDYGSIQNQPSGNLTFHEAMKVEYARKFSITNKTILGQKYISHADLNALTSDDITNGLVDECNDLDAEEKKELKREIAQRVAQTLLAVCTYADIPLRYFRHFLMDKSHGYSDSKLPQPQSSSACGNDTCKVLYHMKLIDEMHKFFVSKVMDDRWFHERSSTEVVPISYVWQGDEKVELGAGAFSSVSEVSIDPAHRGGKSLASDSSKTYALKVFGKDIRNDEKHKDAFRKEIRMLLYLAVYPHPHILNHITSWEQKGTFYILYDKADSNLRDYWKLTSGGDLSKERVLWLLQQLHGLADAIRKVHQLREPPSIAQLLRSKSKSSKSKVSRLTSLDYRHEDINNKRIDQDKAGMKRRDSNKKKRKTGIVGFHHDIKPENILVFGKRDQLPTLKVSDFGAGKFSIVRGQESGRAASKARGTNTYFGPEFDPDMKHKMTRPFDMWALGCVFLEYLLWFFGMQETIPGTGKSFASFRTHLSSPGNGEIIDYFWQKTNLKGQRRGSTTLEVPRPSFAINSRVEDVIDLLEHDICKGLPAFLNVIQIIRSLLKIEPTERLSAVDLSNKLDAILAQAEVDLNRPSNSSDSYLKRFEQNQRQSPTKFKSWGKAANQAKLPPATKLKPFPPQIAVAQNPSADVSSIGSSRRRSLPDLRSGSGTDDEQQNMIAIEDFAPTGVGSQFDKRGQEDMYRSSRDPPYQTQSSDEEYYSSARLPVEVSKGSSKNEPWNQFRSAKPKTPSPKPSPKHPSYMSPTQSSSARIHPRPPSKSPRRLSQTTPK